MPTIKVKDWSIDDRPREKLAKKGVTALSNAELIAILLHSGTPSNNVVDIAKQVLLLANNQLTDLGKLDISQFQKVKGIGEAKAITLMAALELGRRRAAVVPEERPLITCAKDVYDLFYPILLDIPHEEFHVLFLNNANRVIAQTRLSQGGLTNTTVDIRIILKKAIECLATGIILVHNHPSGNPQPSREDCTITKKLKEALAVFDMRLLDHLIIAHEKNYSFADNQAL